LGVESEHIARITRALPGAHVELSGSQLLDGVEPNDIDLVVIVDEVGPPTSVLVTLFEPLYPHRWDDDWAAFRDPGPPQVDVVVTREGSWGDLHHRRAWQLITARPDLQDEYRRLERTADAKARFFERVVGEL
jgi:hypothetical protein